MPFKLKRIYVHNIRSLKDTEILIDNPNGVIRVGGRNGQGKSTAFYTGLYILLGLSSALPHVTWDCDKAMYEVENSHGRFGFKVEGRKVYYYYQLNTGERDMSDATVNNNRCIDIIRAYLGFNVDGEFKSVLNINSGKALNFVVTNGRSELGFLKDMLFSEEIENLQAQAIEEEKNLKIELTRVSDKIHFINGELFNIKTYDEGWIRNTIQWLNEVEEGLEGLNHLKQTLLKTAYYQLRFKRIERNKIDDIRRLVFLQAIELPLLLKKRELAEMKCIRIDVNEARSKLSIVNQIKGLQDKTSLIKKELPYLECRKSLFNMKSNLKNIKSLALNKKKLEVNLNILLFKQTKSQIKDYYVTNLEHKLSLTRYTRNNFLDYEITSKNLVLIKVKSNTINNNLVKVYLSKFKSDLVIYKKVLLEKTYEQFSTFKYRLSDYEKSNKACTNLNKELDDKIYKDGRCVLCYSKKS